MAAYGPFRNALAAIPASSMFARIALSHCRKAVMYNVHNWAFSFMKGLRALGHISMREAGCSGCC